MVVDRDSATDPHGVEIASGQVINPAGTADSFKRGVEPRGEENPRINRVASGLGLGGFDPLVQRRQVERFAVLPDQTHAMIAGNEMGEREKPHLNLGAFGRLVRA